MPKFDKNAFIQELKDTGMYEEYQKLKPLEKQAIKILYIKSLEEDIL